jgi:phosphodiesterase/alkaline phosphatase D-like protein
VGTTAPSSPTQTTATLNATVNPNGGEVSDCRFEYGTSEAYESSVPCSSLPGSGSSPIAVSASVVSLSANTTYHFRISATNAGGASTDPLGQTFTTPPKPPTVETTTASPSTQTTATLNATVNPNGGEVSDCHFEYGTSSVYGSSVPCTQSPGSGSSPIAVSASVVSLSANTTYHFRISAANAGGASTGADQTLKTTPNPPTVETTGPSAPTQTAATLNATVSPNGGEVSDCHFEYGTTEAYGASVPCSSLPGSGSSPVEVSAAVGSLSANTTYHFRISASNPGGASFGSDHTLTTLPNPPTVETAAASPSTQTATTLNATVNPNGGEVSSCRFEYGSTETYGSSAPCSASPGSGSSPVEVSAAVGSLSANTTYHFRISATNSGGTSSGSDRTLKTLPNPPTVLTAAASSLTQSTATVHASVNPNEGAVSDCHFEYGTSSSYGSSAPCSPAPGSGGAPVAVSASLASLAPNTTYHFRISASNPGGASFGSDHAFATLEGLPELGRCSAVPAQAGVHHGRYADSECVTRSETSTGEFEWQSGVARAATKASGGRSIIETVGKAKFICKGEAASGEYTGPKSETVQLALTGCENATKVSCQSEGAPAGVIRAFPLEGQLGFIKARRTGTLIEPKVGWDLKPTTPAAAFARFECGDQLKEAVVQVTVGGSVIANAVTIDRMSATSVLRYEASTGVQRPERFEGGATDVLLVSVAGGASEPSGLTANETATNEEALEIKALP